MPDHFASYIVHVLPSLPDDLSDIDLLVAWDAVLDRQILPSIRLSSSWHDLDTYLQVRPARFDRIAQLLKQRRVWLGPWYRGPGADIEDMIGDLLLARQSALVFKTRLSTALVQFPYVVPTVFAGFGYKAICQQVSWQQSDISVVSSVIPAAEVAAVDDTFDPVIWRQQAAGSVQRLALTITGYPDDILRQFQIIREALPHDDVFLTHPESLGAQCRTTGHSEVAEFTVALVDRLALTYARRLDEGKSPSVPWQAVRRFSRWRRAAEDGTEQLSLIDCVRCEPAMFRIQAVKPREDGQSGVVVRGINVSNERVEVRLRLWRRFSSCAIVRLDEEATGGQLVIEADGSVSFMASPRRLLTFWFQ